MGSINPQSSYSSSSPSYSQSSSAVASWYCWYSATRSFMLLSASVNSISSIPSPVYQCKKAFLLNMAVNCSLTRRNISWIEVEFPMNVDAILRPVGGMSHTLRDSQCAVLLRSSRGQRSKTDHEEVKTGEWNEVHSKFPEIRVKLARKPQAAEGSPFRIQFPHPTNGRPETLYITTEHAIAIFRFLANNIQDGINQLSSLRVMPLGPVVTGAGLSEHEVIGPENLAVGPRPDAVHGTRFQIHENSPRHIPPAASLVVVHIDALQLQIGIPLVASGGVDAVLRAHHLPELGPDLVAALATLNVKNLTHFQREKKRTRDSLREMEGRKWRGVGERGNGEMK
nr:protein TUB [Ipomoea batatas]GMD18867.1 protein TUB [Ipomoea batatas]